MVKKIKASFSENKLFIHAALLLLGAILAWNIIGVLGQLRWWGSASLKDFDFPSSNLSISGYDVQNNRYTNTVGDANIEFGNIDGYVGNIRFVFAQPLEQEIEISIYYAESTHGYSEKNKVTQIVAAQSTEAIIEVGFNVTTCRADIGTTAGEIFYLDKIIVNDSSYKYLLVLKQLKNMIWEILLASVLVIAIRGIKIEKSIETGKWVVYLKDSDVEIAKKILLIFVLFVVYFNVAANLPIDMAPDEYMRDDVPFWMYEHNALPIGNEPELLNNVWGFSYAFMPYLPSIIAYMFMKMFSIVNASTEALQLAMRSVSIFSGLGCVFFSLKLGRYLFKNKLATYLLAISIGFLPQIVFLSGYLNNDIFSLMTCMAILYYLVSGRAEHWPIQKCVGLAVSISACLLTYYFAYGWIIISILFCIDSCLRDNSILDKKSFIIKRILLVAVIVFILAGWYFIRNAMIYDGDFLGIKASRECAEAYAAAGHDVYISVSPRDQGLDLSTILFPWFLSTFNSLIGVFGYMNIPMQQYMYYLYYSIILIGIISYAFWLIKCRRDKLLSISLIVTFICPIVFSLFQSYTMGYQAQGRYIISALPAIMIFMIQGYEGLFCFYHAHFKKYKSGITKLQDSNIEEPFFATSGYICLILVWIFAFIHVYISIIHGQLIP
ncbi:ArnT family glycosyltransferase [Candidatus Agathobaculum pullicola]|uniref:ArnT family glycosyltransferase n=1 Tax=Candidatus Agathobaculum pullicola TaxID=2838426 RepID=UPI003F8E4144